MRAQDTTTTKNTKTNTKYNAPKFATFICFCQRNVFKNKNDGFNGFSVTSHWPDSPKQSSPLVYTVTFTPGIYPPEKNNSIQPSSLPAIVVCCWLTPINCSYEQLIFKKEKEGEKKERKKGKGGKGKEFMTYIYSIY